MMGSCLTRSRESDLGSTTHEDMWEQLECIFPEEIEVSNGYEDFQKLSRIEKSIEAQVCICNDGTKGLLSRGQKLQDADEIRKRSEAIYEINELARQRRLIAANFTCSLRKRTQSLGCLRCTVDQPKCAYCWDCAWPRFRLHTNIGRTHDCLKCSWSNYCLDCLGKKYLKE